MNFLLNLISTHLKHTFKDITFNLELINDAKETLISCTLTSKKTSLELIYSPDKKVAHCMTHLTKKNIKEHSTLFKVVLSILKILACKQLTFKLESEDLIKSFETFISKDKLSFDAKSKEMALFLDVEEE